MARQMAVQHGTTAYLSGSFRSTSEPNEPSSWNTEAIANQKERAKADTCPEHGKFEKVKNLGNKVRARGLDYFGWLFGGATHAHLRKMCEYFADDKDGESLQQDWAKAEPSDKEAKQGWLAGWGSVVMRMVLPKHYRL